MRVLNSMIDPRIGGPQLRSLAVAKRLRAHDVETEFLVPDGDDEFVKRVQKEGFRAHQPGLSRLKSLNNIRNNIVYSLKFPVAVHKIQQLIDRRSIDVVHANMAMNIEAAIASRFSTSSLVWHFNDVLLQWPIVKGTRLLAERIADEIVVASDSVGEYYFGESRRPLNVVYAPVDVNRFDPAVTSSGTVRKDFGVDNSTTLIGSIGNINPIKGHEYLIKAANELKNKTGEDFAVAIVGGVLDSRSDYHRRLERLVQQLNLEEEVKFVGRRNDIPQVLDAIDVFALPSVAEACPMAVLEAMAMAKPVVATDVGGIPEQIVDGESGWLVPPKDPTRMAEAILDALSDEDEAERRGVNARQRVKEQFSLERCVQRHLEVYQKAGGNWSG